MHRAELPRELGLVDATAIVVGTVIGAALLAVIANALVIVGINQYWYQAGLGLIILGAVTLDQARLRLLMAGRL